MISYLVHITYVRSGVDGSKESGLERRKRGNEWRMMAKEKENQARTEHLSAVSEEEDWKVKK